jgi:hypothetical protein
LENFGKFKFNVFLRKKRFKNSNYFIKAQCNFYFNIKNYSCDTQWASWKKKKKQLKVFQKMECPARFYALSAYLQIHQEKSQRSFPT